MGTAIVLAALVIAVVFIVRKLARDKKSGRACSSCPSGDCGCGCHKKD